MTWLPTTTGRVFDLMAPDWRAVDLMADVADGLAKIARYTGTVPQGPFSVAQHSIVGADAVYRDTGDRAAAAAFLLHDAHEYVLNDKTSPAAEAEALTAEALCPGAGGVVIQMQRLMKRRVDLAIYQAAGMGTDGCPERYRRIVAEYDLRMLVTERAHLLVPCGKRWAEAVEAAAPLRLVGRLTCWPWPKAADEYRERLRRYLPETFAPQPAPRAPTPGFAARRKPAPAKILTEA